MKTSDQLVGFEHLSLVDWTIGGKDSAVECTVLYSQPVLTTHTHATDG